MRFSTSIKTFAVGAMVAFAVAGCAGPKTHPPETWKLPPKANPDAAMFVGRIGMHGNDKLLILNYVNFQLWGKVYVYAGHAPKGEKNFVMDNNYFVVPNLKPGKYGFAGFHATGDYNVLSRSKDDLIELKPGEIRFVGSFDYVDGKSNTLRTIVGVPGTYSLKRAAHPTELEMMRWLLRIGNGSGWEPAIKQRIRQLGGRV